MSDFCSSFGGVLGGVAATAAAVWWAELVVGPIPGDALAHRCGLAAIWAGAAAFALVLLGLRPDEAD